ncbi:hypothetical protein [Streptomyces sp. NPDC059003]|uniref:hypothetical protein n=1 Tax=Streptomyces sp. NPDC059003 TaxID=3346691 RepID=UPI0036A9AFD3
MTSTAPRATLTPIEAAALRARITAQVARDRFAPPATITALRYIASHLDRAAEAFEREAPRGAAQALSDAREIAQLQPDTRFPANFTDYIEAPLTGVALPMLAPLNPVSLPLAEQEAHLRDRLAQIHEQLSQATSEPATDAWLPSALSLQRDLMKLAGAVRVDNARPCNQRSAAERDPNVYDTESSASRQHYIDTGRYLTWDETAEQHVRCPKCRSSSVRFAVRQWATCQCGHGDLWSAFMSCDCSGYDCPAIQRPAQH